MELHILGPHQVVGDDRRALALRGGQVGVCWRVLRSTSQLELASVTW